MRTRLIILAAITALAALGVYFDLFQYLTPERLGDIAESAGMWGPVILVVLFSVLQPFAVPGAIFMLAAAALYPFWLAFLVSWAGSVGAAMFGFGFARYLARDWVSGRLPERLRKWDERLSNEGLSVVIVFRTMFFLNPASHWAIGLSQVKASTATLGTAIAFVPWIAAWTFFGEQILFWFQSNSTELILGIVLAIVAAIGVAVLIRRHRARAAAAEIIETSSTP